MRRIIDGSLDVLVVIIGIPMFSLILIAELFAAMAGFFHLTAFLGWRSEGAYNSGLLAFVLLCIAAIGYIAFEQLPPHPQDTSPVRYVVAWLIIHLTGTVVFTSAIVGPGIFVASLAHNVQLSDIANVRNEIPLRTSGAFTAFTAAALVAGAAISHIYTQRHRYTPSGWGATHKKSQRRREPAAAIRAAAPKPSMPAKPPRAQRASWSLAGSTALPLLRNYSPALVGICVAIGTFSGIAAGFSQSISLIHVILATVASIVAGAIAWTEWHHRRSGEK